MPDNWLSQFNPGTRINVLAIPGTHDAASVTGASSAPLTITQRLDITEQLDAGVRVLDMRVAHIAEKSSGGWIRERTVVPEDIYMCHGPIVFATKLSEALDSIKSWLSESAHKYEFVAMIFQQQGKIPTDVTEKRRLIGLIKDTITNAFSGGWMFRPEEGTNDWPTIGQLKKKVLVFSRLQDDFPGAFDLRAWNAGSLTDMISAQYDIPDTNLKVAIQDRYTKVTNTDFTDHLNRGLVNNIAEINAAKMILFERLNAQYNDDPTLKINHLSHSLKSPTYPQPYMLGTDLNERLIRSLENKDARYRGFVMIDDANPTVCKSIINSNLIFRKDTRRVKRRGKR